MGEKRLRRCDPGHIAWVRPRNGFRLRSSGPLERVVHRLGDDALTARRPPPRLGGGRRSWRRRVVRRQRKGRQCGSRCPFGRFRGYERNSQCGLSSPRPAPTTLYGAVRGRVLPSRARLLLFRASRTARHRDVGSEAPHGQGPTPADVGRLRSPGPSANGRGKGALMGSRGAPFWRWGRHSFCAMQGYARQARICGSRRDGRVLANPRDCRTVARL